MSGIRTRVQTSVFREFHFHADSRRDEIKRSSPSRWYNKAKSCPFPWPRGLTSRRVCFIGGRHRDNVISVEIPNAEPFERENLCNSIERSFEHESSIETINLYLLSTLTLQPLDRYLTAKLTLRRA